MANRPHVPKFGTWDANANTNGPAYTAVFEQARAGKGGKPSHPYEQAENPVPAANVGYGGSRGAERPPPRGRMNQDQDEAPVTRQRHERRSSREDVDMRRQNEPPARYPPYDQPPTRRPPAGPTGDAPVSRYGGRGGMAPQEPPPRRVVGDRDAGSNHSDRGNGDGSGHNADRSPAHPSYANRVGARESNRGSASPAWDRNKRQSSGDEGSVFAPGTPKNNSRLRQGVPRQQEEPPAKGGALPKFGDWNAKDPTSGDGFTMIFQKLSTEKKEGGPVHIPKLNTDSPARSVDDHHHITKQSTGQRKNSSSGGEILMETWECYLQLCIRTVAEWFGVKLTHGKFREDFTVDALFCEQTRTELQIEIGCVASVAQSTSILLISLAGATGMPTFFTFIMVSRMPALPPSTLKG